MPRQLPLKGLTRDALTGFKGLARAGARPHLRSTAAVLTTMTALAATSLVAGPSVAEPFSAQSCALQRTDAHHSEGLDTWNAAYPRPARALDAVMVFLSFPDARPRTTPAELAADHFPATSDFFARASYGRFTLRPHPLRTWIRMPRPSTAYAIQRDWSAAHRAAYLRDALAAADGDVDFSRYDVVYFVADPDAPGVDSDATKVVNLDVPLRADGTDIRRVVTVFEKHPPDRLVLAHETGHVFDLPDLYHRPMDGQGRLGHVRRRLGPDGQPVRAGAGPVRLAQVEARLAGTAPGGVRPQGRFDPADPGTAGGVRLRPRTQARMRIRVCVRMWVWVRSRGQRRRGRGRERRSWGSGTSGRATG